MGALVADRHRGAGRHAHVHTDTLIVYIIGSATPVVPLTWFPELTAGLESWEPLLLAVTVEPAGMRGSRTTTCSAGVGRASAARSA
jgi:hypothetical protein